MNSQIITETLQGLSSSAYRAFGAHPSYEYDQTGVRFTVYAPHARKVSLIGDFNGWNGYEMERQESGVWSIFAANIPLHSLYKYQITTQSGEVYDRIDPFAFLSQVRPDTASVVYDIEGFSWNDEAWMKNRTKNYNRALQIYEVHAGSWRINPDKEESERFYSYTQLKNELIPYLKEMEYTHLELLPLTEHPFDGSWGYQATGYYSATSRYGEPKELMAFINRCHQENIGVILDFVPLHFVTDFYALHQYDGGFLYESESESLRYSQWSTALFDFTKPYVLSFLKSALDFWIHYYHLDGIRYDAVSNLIYHHGNPENGMNEAGIWFLKNVNYTLSQKYPDVMLIAEDSSNYLKVTAPIVYGGLGFDYKWNLGWMHDILEYLSLNPHDRGRNHHKLTFSISYFYQELYILPFSHDEVVHGKGTIIDKLYGSYTEKFHQLRSLYFYMYTHPGKKLNFMGNELAEFREWDESKELGWNLLSYPAHESFHRFLKELHRLYNQESALFAADYHMEGFRWIDANNARQSVIAYQRNDLEGNIIYAVINFSGNFYPHYSLKVDESGIYEELLNTDNSSFGGSGIQNGECQSRPNHFGHELQIGLAPYSSCIFKKKQI